MTKLVSLTLTLIFAFTFTPAFAKEKPPVINRIEVGQGCLKYPWGDGEVVLFQDKQTCSGVGNGGIVTPTTKILINGKGGSKRDLRYLNNKEVYYHLRFRQVGKGEGSKTYATSLNLIVDEEMP